MDELDIIVDHMWLNITTPKNKPTCKLENLREISDREEEIKFQRENNLEKYDYE